MNRSLPARDEAVPYYFRYIDRVSGTDVVGELERQLPAALDLFRGISEDKSRHRYEPGKWSVRQVVNHVSDVERLMSFRAMWFARGFTAPLPSFDEGESAKTAKADDLPWPSLLQELETVRLATVSLFRNLPEEAWDRKGEASGNPFTVRALAYVCAGHLLHHEAVVRERYL